MTIEHLQYGPLIYEKVYLAIDKPILFMASATKQVTKFKYIGVLYKATDEVDTYLIVDMPSQTVLDKLEAGRMTLIELYTTYPRWQVEVSQDLTVWNYCSVIPDDCVFSNEATLKGYVI